MYKTTDLAIIIPTKDRPVQVKRHLQSLVDQNCELGRVIVVASGQDIKNIVLGFADSLPVEYYYSEPGQIRQRSLGISKLDEKIKLVASMDDDITYESEAINSMVSFWNTTNAETAGVGFNIIETKGHCYSWIKGLIGFDSKEEGKVLKNGSNLSLRNIDQTIFPQYLNGGSTVWKKSILQKFPHHSILSKRAFNEDVIYSYPIWKKGYEMIVYHGACVRMEEIPGSFSMNKYKDKYYMAKASVFWRYLLVIQNKNLSIGALFIRVTFTFIYNIFGGIITLNRGRLSFSMGIFSGIFSIFYSGFHQKKDIIALIEELG